VSDVREDPEANVTPMQLIRNIREQSRDTAVLQVLDDIQRMLLHKVPALIASALLTRPTVSRESDIMRRPDSVRLYRSMYHVNEQQVLEALRLGSRMRLRAFVEMRPGMLNTPVAGLGLLDANLAEQDERSAQTLLGAALRLDMDELVHTLFEEDALDMNCPVFEGSDVHPLTILFEHWSAVKRNRVMCDYGKNWYNRTKYYAMFKDFVTHHVKGKQQLHFAKLWTSVLLIGDIEPVGILARGGVPVNLAEELAGTVAEDLVEFYLVCAKGVNFDIVHELFAVQTTTVPSIESCEDAASLGCHDPIEWLFHSKKHVKKNVPSGFIYMPKQDLIRTFLKNYEHMLLMTNFEDPALSMPACNDARVQWAAWRDEALWFLHTQPMRFTLASARHARLGKRSLLHALDDAVFAMVVKHVVGVDAEVWVEGW
jgi:hypothetical protein